MFRSRRCESPSPSMKIAGWLKFSKEKKWTFSHIYLRFSMYVSFCRRRMRASPINLIWMIFLLLIKKDTILSPSLQEILLTWKVNQLGVFPYPCSVSVAPLMRISNTSMGYRQRWPEWAPYPLFNYDGYLNFTKILQQLMNVLLRGYLDSSAHFHWRRKTKWLHRSIPTKIKVAIRCLKCRIELPYGSVKNMEKHSVWEKMGCVERLFKYSARYVQVDSGSALSACIFITFF